MLKLRTFGLTLRVMCTALAACTSIALGADVARAASATPPAETIAALRDWKPQGGDLPALLRQVLPQLAATYLRSDVSLPVERGGPLDKTLGADLSAKLDAAPGGLPMVVYKKEDGRLPGAFILARYRNVTPLQILYRLPERAGVVRHPLVDQYQELTPLRNVAAGPWGAGATVKQQTTMVALQMPTGSGLFGLRDSYAFGEWETVLLGNGVGVIAFTSRPPTADERARFAKFKDKKGRDKAFEDDYYEAREYFLSSVFIPEQDPSGQWNTVHLYFVRIVPALKPGTDLVGSGALARWLFARGAQDALVMPVQLIRDEVRRLSGK